MDSNYTTNHLNEEEDLDIKRYLSLFLSNWYWFAIALFISIVFAYGKNRYSDKIYTVSATLLINDDQFGGGSPDMNIFPGSKAFKSKQNIKNELGILKSFSLNYRVMKDLPSFNIVYIGVGRRGIVESRMYKNAPFRVVYGSIENQKIGVPITIEILSTEKYRLDIDGDYNYSKELNFGELFDERGFNFLIIPSDTSRLIFNQDASNKYYFFFTSPARMANQYRNKLNILPIDEDATIVTLSTSGYVPEQEADYINRLMDIYLQQGLELKNQTAQKTIEFIDEQLGSISDSLMIAENRLKDFKLSNKLIDMSKEGAIIQNRLESFENDSNKLIQEKKYYEYLLDYINSKNETGDIVSPGVIGVTNAPLEKLVGELAILQQQKNKMKLNISEDLPAITLIDNEIKITKSMIVENIISSMKNLEYGIKLTYDRISQIEAEINKLPGTEIKLNNIQRKVDLINTIYTYLLEKKAEAGIARASAVSDNRIIDRADIFNSAMISPKPNQNIAIALLFGFLVPLLLIFLVDYFNNVIIDKKDVERGTEAPIIGYVSHNTYKSELPVNEKPGSTLAESFRLIRSNLKYFFKENESAVLAISSTISGEGKTFISMNLACIFAMLGKKVLVIGLDLRKPRIHKILEVEKGKGMSAYLSGSDTFDKVIQPTKIKNLYYANAGEVPPNPAELIETLKMKEFIEKAKKEFDYIIIDTPPIAIVTDALLIAPYIDMYLLVIRQRYSSKNTLNLIQELYRKGTLNKVGLIINDIKLSGYYGYGLRYRYSIRYGYSYGYNYYGKYSYGKSRDKDIREEYYTDD